MKLANILFLIGVLMTPFYFFSSGGVQVADLFFMLSLLTVITNRNNYLLKMGIKKAKYFSYLKVFIFWCFTVNIVYYLIWFDNKTLLASIYYLYNFSLIILVFALYKFDNNLFLRKLFYTLILSLIFVVFVGVFELDYLFANKYVYRRAVTFNNPNQLGYWTLIVLALIFVIYRSIDFKFRFKNVLLLLSIPMVFYLSMISLSKASSVSIIMLISLFTFNKIKIVIPMMIIFTSLFYLIEFKEDNFIGKFNKRLNSIGQANDDNFEGRNYDRIWIYPEYLFLGAGEGAVEQRFKKNNEIHSTFGTIIFSYGIIGLFLFSLFLYKLFKRDIGVFIAILLPVLAFGITHMGLRFKLFWVLFPLFEIYINRKNKLIINGRKRQRKNS